MKNFSLPDRSLKLRYKAGLIFFVPLAIIMMIISSLHFMDERKAYNRQLELATAQLGAIIRGSLRHALISNDQAALQAMLVGIVGQESIEKVRIAGLDGKIKYSSSPAEVGMPGTDAELGCQACHKILPAARPAFVHASSDARILRIGLPIENSSDCQVCHSANLPHLGVLLLDANFAETTSALAWDLGTDFGLSVITLLISLFLGFALLQWLVVQRVEVIQKALTDFGAGDFSVRIPGLWQSSDELAHLAWQFNDMAEKFELLRKEHDEKQDVRIKTIVEERERVARELHDGVAQFLGYASAKTGAIMLALNNNKPDVARKNIQQLEQVIDNQSVEVRAAILGLKMAGRMDEGLTSNIQTYLLQCKHLFDFEIEFEIGAGAEDVHLGAETELQLMRILQETISNVRKHARARKVLVRLEKSPALTKLSIWDDGVGFDRKSMKTQPALHFGLQIIRERARAIKALVEFNSTPGSGTLVIVTVPMAEAQ